MNQEQMSQSQSNQQNQPKKTSPAIWVVFVILAVLIIGGFGWYAYSTMQPEEEIIVVTPTKKSTPTATSTTVSDETADWKVYTNDSFGLSFKYPKTYEISMEGDINKDSITGIGGDTTNNLSLEDNTRNGKPGIDFLFNPDGYGPGNEDIYYQTKIENNKLSISERKITEENEFNNDDTTIISFEIGYLYGKTNSGEDNGKGIIVKYGYSNGDYENELKEIIKTIKITKPEIYGKK